jgi:hypothetical protein
MKSHGFRFIVLLACTIYHGGLLLLLNMNQKQPADCQWKSYESYSLSADNFEVVERNSRNISAIKPINDLFLDILDEDMSNTQPHGIKREGTTTPVSIAAVMPEKAASSYNKSADTPVDRGAWIVFCVTRWAYVDSAGFLQPCHH